MSDDEESCPLCMEPLMAADKAFYPCPCGYQVRESMLPRHSCLTQKSQICLWCFHKLCDDDALATRCPACRTPYDIDSIQFPEADPEEVLREQREQKKRERMAKKKAKTTKSRDHLMSVRVIQRNLVYVIGLSPSLAKEEVLRRPDCFSIYGKIIKVVVNRQQFHGEGKPPSASAYITYEKPADARLAILSVDGFVYEGRTIRASYGTTKYCHQFLRYQPCNNSECLYLHDVGDSSDSFTQDELRTAEGKKHFQELTNPSDPYVRPELPPGRKPPIVPLPVVVTAGGASRTMRGRSDTSGRGGGGRYSSHDDYHNDEYDDYDDEGPIDDWSDAMEDEHQRAGGNQHESGRGSARDRQTGTPMSSTGADSPVDQDVTSSQNLRIAAPKSATTATRSPWAAAVAGGLANQASPLTVASNPEEYPSLDSGPTLVTVSRSGSRGRTPTASPRAANRTASTGRSKRPVTTPLVSKPTASTSQPASATAPAPAPAPPAPQIYSQEVDAQAPSSLLRPADDATWKAMDVLMPSIAQLSLSPASTAQSSTSLTAPSDSTTAFNAPTHSQPVPPRTHGAIGAAGGAYPQLPMYRPYAQYQMHQQPGSTEPVRSVSDGAVHSRIAGAAGMHEPHVHSHSHGMSGPLGMSSIGGMVPPPMHSASASWSALDSMHSGGLAHSHSYDSVPGMLPSDLAPRSMRTTSRFDFAKSTTSAAATRPGEATTSAATASHGMPAQHSYTSSMPAPPPDLFRSSGGSVGGGGGSAESLQDSLRAILPGRVRMTFNSGAVNVSGMDPQNPSQQQQPQLSAPRGPPAAQPAPPGMYGMWQGPGAGAGSQLGFGPPGFHQHQQGPQYGRPGDAMSDLERLRQQQAALERKLQMGGSDAASGAGMGMQQPGGAMDGSGFAYGDRGSYMQSAWQTGPPTNVRR